MVEVNLVWACVEWPSTSYFMVAWWCGSSQSGAGARRSLQRSRILDSLDTWEGETFGNIQKSQAQPTSG